MSHINYRRLDRVHPNVQKAREREELLAAKVSRALKLRRAIERIARMSGEPLEVVGK